MAGLPSLASVSRAPSSVSPLRTLAVPRLATVRSAASVTSSRVTESVITMSWPPAPGSTVAWRSVGPVVCEKASVKAPSTCTVVATSRIPPVRASDSREMSRLITVMPVRWVMVTSPATSITTLSSGPGRTPPDQLAGSSQKPPAGLIQVTASPVSVKSLTTSTVPRAFPARSVTASASITS